MLIARFHIQLAGSQGVTEGVHRPHQLVDQTQGARSLAVVAAARHYTLVPRTPGDHHSPLETEVVEPASPSPAAGQREREQEHQAEVRLAFAEEEAHSDSPSEAYLSPLPYQESGAGQCSWAVSCRHLAFLGVLRLGERRFAASVAGRCVSEPVSLTFARLHHRVARPCRPSCRRIERTLACSSGSGHSCWRWRNRRIQSRRRKRIRNPWRGCCRRGQPRKKGKRLVRDS